VRILMLAQFYAPIVGGEERIVQDLARGLTRRGHHVSVATLRQDGLAPFELDGQVRVHRIPSAGGPLRQLARDVARRHAPPAPDPVTLHALRAIVAREQPEIVHAHNWLAHSFLPLKRWSGARLLMSLHDYSLVCATKRLVHRGAVCSGPGARKCVGCATAHYGARGAPIAAANWAMYAAQRRSVDLFLAVSESVAAQVLRGKDVPYRVIPNFLPDEVVNEGRAPDPRLDVLPTEYLLFVGDVVPDKGAEVLIRAHALVPGAPPLVLIGRVETATRRALPSNVVAVGPWPHELVMEAWRRCLIALVPSFLREPFGLVALEAMASGRPLIASRTGGLPELVGEGESGLLVEPGDVMSLAVAVQQLLGDPYLRARMAEAGKRRARAFTASSVIPRVEAAYRDVLASRPAESAAMVRTPPADDRRHRPRERTCR
jgi:glycosyltransferase involved in cell wall biosynthesis